MKAKNYRTGEMKEVDNFVYCTDMDKIVECPECGKKVRYGELYNVGDWFEPSGVWRLGICPECAEKEWERIRKESEGK